MPAGSEAGAPALQLETQSKRERDTPPHAPAPHRVWEAEAASAGRTEHPEDQLARLAAAVGPLRRLLAALASEFGGE